MIVFRNSADALTVLVAMILSIASTVSPQPSPQRPKKAAKVDPFHIQAELKRFVESGLSKEDLVLLPEEVTRYRVKQFDLNGDGLKEHFVLGWCSPTGNCHLWVIEERKGKFKTLLETSLVQTIFILNVKSNGYFDFQTGSHGSAFESEVTIYKFGSTEYEASDHYVNRWEYDDETGKTKQVEGRKESPGSRQLFRR